MGLCPDVGGGCTCGAGCVYENELGERMRGERYYKLPLVSPQVPNMVLRRYSLEKGRATRASASGGVRIFAGWLLNGQESTVWLVW